MEFLSLSDACRAGNEIVAWSSLFVLDTLAVHVPASATSASMSASSMALDVQPLASHIQGGGLLPVPAPLHSIAFIDSHGGSVHGKNSGRPCGTEDGQGFRRGRQSEVLEQRPAPQSAVRQAQQALSRQVSEEPLAGASGSDESPFSIPRAGTQTATSQPLSSHWHRWRRKQEGAPGSQKDVACIFAPKGDAKDRNITASYTLRAITTTWLLHRLKDDKLPQQLQPRLAELLRIDLEDLSKGIAKMAPRYPTPIDSRPWTFQLMPTSSIIGERLLKFFAELQMHLPRDEAKALLLITQPSVRPGPLAQSLREHLPASGAASSQKRTSPQKRRPSIPLADLEG